MIREGFSPVTAVGEICKIQLQISLWMEEKAEVLLWMEEKAEGRF